MAHVAKYTLSSVNRLLNHYDRSKSNIGENVDVDRSKLNYNLSTNQGEQFDILQKRMSEIKCLKRADVNVMCDWAVTLPTFTHSNSALSVSPDKEKVERLFFERTFQFLANRYGEQNVVSAYVHKDEATPHMHFAFVPVSEDKKRGGEKLSAKEVLTKKDLQTFHADLEAHLDSFGDWHFNVLNESTKDGNKTIAELKKQTAREEVQKAQQEVKKAQQEVFNVKARVEEAKNEKNAIEGEILALQTKKTELTEQEVRELNGKRSLFGGLKGVTFQEYEALKRTALNVDKMKAERDGAIARATRTEKALAEAEQNIKSLEHENKTLSIQNSFLSRKILELEKALKTLSEIIKEKLPEIWSKIVKPKQEQESQRSKRPKQDLEL